MLENVVAFLDREQHAINEAYSEYCGQPHPQRVASGDTLGPLSYLGKDQLGLLQFAVRSDAGSRFRAGDYGYLGPAAMGEDLIERGMAVKLVSLDQVTQVLVLERDTNVRSKWPEPRLSDLLYFDDRKTDLTNLYKNASKRAMEEPSQLIQALVRGTQSIVDEAQFMRFEEFGASFDLDDSQCLAFASRARFPLALIQGPPGTGKSYVLGKMASGYLFDKKRVLICAMTHRAVNNALGKCYEFSRHLDATLPIMKLGDRTQESKLHPSIERLAQRDVAVSRILSHSGPLLLGTSVARVPGLVSKGIKFDVVFFDEAGQLTLPQVLCGAIASEQAVFFGDHKQLPPIVVGKHPINSGSLEKSAFELLAQVHPVTTLNISYRLNKELVKFSSRQFYNDKLVASSDSKDKRLKIAFPIDNPLFPILDPAFPLVWVEMTHRFQSNPCMEEVELACALVQHALESGISYDEIAVISPFRKQNHAITKRLQMLPNSNSRRVTVDTVERMQGQERELVIISLCLSDSESIEAQSEFIYSPNRLNVSVTRARNKCIVLGNRELLCPTSQSEAVLAGAALFRDLVDCSHVVPMPSFIPQREGQSTDGIESSNQVLERFANQPTLSPIKKLRRLLGFSTT